MPGRHRRGADQVALRDVLAVLDLRAPAVVAQEEFAFDLDGHGCFLSLKGRRKYQGCIAPKSVIPAKARIQLGTRARHAKPVLSAAHACFTGFRPSPE